MARKVCGRRPRQSRKPWQMLGWSKRSRRLGFPHEAGLVDLGVLQRRCAARNFSATGALKFRVLGLVDDTHAAFTELIGDAVVRDRRADHAGPILP